MRDELLKIKQELKDKELMAVDEYLTFGERRTRRKFSNMNGMESEAEEEKNVSENRR